MHCLAAHLSAHTADSVHAPCCGTGPSRLFEKSATAKLDAKLEGGGLEPWLTTNCEVPAWNSTCFNFDYGRFSMDHFMPADEVTSTAKSVVYAKLDSWLNAQLGMNGKSSYASQFMWNFGVTVLHMKASR